MMKTIDNARLILSLMDLTRLEEHDDTENIKIFCQQLTACQAIMPVVYPAAICVYSQYLDVVHHTLQMMSIPAIKLATVTNFPSGKLSVKQVISEINLAVKRGASEIDVVFPWELYLAGNHNFASRFVTACKSACPEGVLLKVILETGKLEAYEVIYRASCLVIDAGADFIKTSTGKVTINATLHAADAMLKAIKASGSSSCGFKASGGIRTVSQASEYIMLAEQIMSEEWINPQSFRFGASGLLRDVLSVLAGQQNAD